MTSSHHMDRDALEEAIAVAQAHRANARPYAIPVGAMTTNTGLDVVLAAARAHLATLPRTKTVEVWRVEHAYGGQPKIHQFERQEDAVAKARNLETGDPLSAHRCIRVTGPHKQEVPA